MTDRNMVFLSGTLAGVSQRSIGAQGRTLYEARLELSKPAGRGREAEAMVVPVICWQPEVGLAVETLEPGTPVVVLGRVSARSWTPAGGGAEKIFTEIVAESITVDVSAVCAPSEAAPAVTGPAKNCSTSH
jgi:single-stranded DNA-binding protein